MLTTGAVQSNHATYPETVQTTHCVRRSSCSWYFAEEERQNRGEVQPGWSNEDPEIIAGLGSKISTPQGRRG